MLFGINFGRSLRNQRKSPLLRIPVELRNEIYDHVCRYYRDHKVIIYNTGDYEMPHDALKSLREGKPPGILMTCRQIHSETSFFQFQAGNYEAYLPALVSWSEDLDIGRRYAIHTFRIHFTSDWHLAYLQKWDYQLDRPPFGQKVKSIEALVRCFLQMFPEIKHLILIDRTRDHEIQRIYKENGTTGINTNIQIQV